MKVTPIIPLTGAMVTSTTAPEPGTGEVAWVSGTTYTTGQEVIRTQTHKVYVRRTDGAGTTAPELDLVNWREDRPTNAWAMFTAERNQQTEAAGPLTVVISPGRRINTLALVGLDVDSYDITMESGGATVFERLNQNMILRNSRTATEYCFGGFRYKPSAIHFDLPPFANATITVTLRSARPTLKCGGLHIGNSHAIGQVEYGAQSSQLTFSEVVRDSFGNARLRKVGTLPKTQQSLFFEKALTPKLLQLRRDTDSVPAIWSGLDDRTDSSYFEALLIVGIYRLWDLDLSNFTHGEATLQLEEI